MFNQFALHTRLAIALATCTVGFGALLAGASAEVFSPEREKQLIGELLDRWSKVTPSELSALPAMPVKRFELPTAGVDVMRAVVEETYDIEGVGKDTVTLSGWIAVKHGVPQKMPSATQLRWGTAKIDTEFVGLHLSGKSGVFGDIVVTLDPNKRSLGVVGAWLPDNVPEEAKPLEQMMQLAQQRSVPGFGGVDIIIEQKDGKIELTPHLPGGRNPTQPGIPGLPPTNELQPPPFRLPPNLPNPNASCALAFAAAACNCAANMNLNINLASLGIEATTQSPVYMYSVVETIPPVGYTATVTLMPTALLMNGRRMGTLEHAEVKFRELVEHLSLDQDADATLRLRELEAKK